MPSTLWLRYTLNELHTVVVYSEFYWNSARPVHQTTPERVARAHRPTSELQLRLTIGSVVSSRIYEIIPEDRPTSSHLSYQVDDCSLPLVGGNMRLSHTTANQLSNPFGPKRRRPFAMSSSEKFPDVHKALSIHVIVSSGVQPQSRFKADGLQAKAATQATLAPSCTACMARPAPISPDESSHSITSTDGFINPGDDKAHPRHIHRLPTQRKPNPVDPGQLSLQKKKNFA